MGTHPSLPSKDLSTGRSLLDLVGDNQALMSTEITKKYDKKLPFLFKVLSIAKALSIQAHPNKKLAEKLHARDPKNYPDDNHKPEMTIAITPFEGLCGFRPLQEIAHFLQTIPPLRELVGDAKAKDLEKTAADSDADIVSSKSVLRAAFTSLMKQSSETVKAKSKDLLSLASEQKLTPGPSVNTTAELCELVQRCNSQFPSDIGLFVLFFLNFVKLSPGQAMYLKADDIHAYISGDIIECMASSDNVIRAGFTPKFQDVDTLTEILTYDHEPPEKQLLEPVDYPYAKLNSTAYSSGSECLLYDPPIEEFSVVRTVLKKQGAKATFDGLGGPSIVICTSGSGTISVGPKQEELREGWVYFVGATAECVIESSGDDMVTFTAFCEIGGREETQQANGKGS
jgi:mannose-6-phosphate isomerase